MAREWTIWFLQYTVVLPLATPPTLTLWPSQPSAPMNTRGDLDLGRLQPQQVLSTLHPFPRRFMISTQCRLRSVKFTVCPRTPDAGLKSSYPHPQLGQTYDRSIRPNGWQFIWQLDTGTGQARPGSGSLVYLSTYFSSLSSGLHWLRP